jgi:hypothetical protein
MYANSRAMPAVVGDIPVVHAGNIEPFDPKQSLATSICPMECHVREKPLRGMASHA